MSLYWGDVGVGGASVEVIAKHGEKGTQQEKVGCGHGGAIYAQY